MTVRIERQGKVWTVIHSRPQARNAMDPESAGALVDAFVRFNDDDAAGAARFASGKGRHGDFGSI
jgi:enoyl-CoA hydratase